MKELIEILECIDKRNYIKAREMAENIIYKQPNNRFALDLLVISLRYLGEATKASEISYRAQNIPFPKVSTTEDAEILWRISQLTSKFQKSAYSGNPQALAYANMGSELCKLGKLDEGRDYFQKALHIDPNCEIAHYNMGIFAYNQKDYQLCKKSMLEVIRINPGNQKAKEVLTELENQ